MNQCPYHQDLTEKITRIESGMKVKLINGKEVETELNKAVAEIWQDLALLRDINKLHQIFKRWKVYKILGFASAVLVAMYFGVSIKDLIIKIIS